MNTTTATKWGTSYGIRLNKSILEQFPVQNKEILEVQVDKDKIIFTRAKKTVKHKTLDDIFLERGWDGDTNKPFETEPIENIGFEGEEVPL